jgi:CheB methylesterase
MWLVDRQSTGSDVATHGLWVVGLVASIGGLDAISQVLATLPASYPGAIVVLQHTTPTHPNRLADILSRWTALKVTLAQDGDRLQPRLVLVAPAGRHTLVCPDQTVALITSGPLPPSRPSADLLLTSMALSCEAVAALAGGIVPSPTGPASTPRCRSAGRATRLPQRHDYLRAQFPAGQPLGRQGLRRRHRPRPRPPSPPPASLLAPGSG